MRYLLTSISFPGQLLDDVSFRLGALELEEGDPAKKTFRTSNQLQQEMTKLLTCRDQIYPTTAHWAGTVATTNGDLRPASSPDDYQRVIKKMVDILYEMEEILSLTARRLRRLIAATGGEWPSGPRNAPGIFTFMRAWRPEESVPEAYAIGVLLNFWVRKRGHLFPAITEVITTFGQYESALTDMLQRPPPTEPQQEGRKELRKYAGGYLIWRQHLLGAYCE